MCLDAQFFEGSADSFGREGWCDGVCGYFWKEANNDLRDGSKKTDKTTSLLFWSCICLLCKNTCKVWRVSSGNWRHAILSHAKTYRDTPAKVAPRPGEDFSEKKGEVTIDNSNQCTWLPGYQSLVWMRKNQFPSQNGSLFENLSWAGLICHSAHCKFDIPDFCWSL